MSVSNSENNVENNEVVLGVDNIDELLNQAVAEDLPETNSAAAEDSADAPAEEPETSETAESVQVEQSTSPDDVDKDVVQEPDRKSEKKSKKKESDEVTFADMGLDPAVLEAVTEVGYETPSAIQAETIPLVLEGRDVVGLAQTGTGKTAAFALPILSRIDPNARHTQALILAPTRELALQVAEACVKYSSKMQRVNVLPIYGGQAYGVQLAGLRRGAQIVVGTPGRVIDHLRKGTLDLSNLAHLVLDEADEMLTMGFQEDVERVLEDTPEDAQIALFSATMPGPIRRISQQYLTDPTEVKVASSTKTASTIAQRYVMVNHRDKLDALTRVLEVETFDAMIMFVRTKQATEELAERLRARGFSASAINGDIPQAQRERTIDQLKSARIDILVATDVAARGLDVPRISHVVNYDIPHDVESYIHRIGRTGRAGRTGTALLFVTPRERRLLNAIERSTKQPLTEDRLPSVSDVNERRKVKFAASITESLQDKHIGLFRELVENYAEEHETSMADIAAALATQSRNSGEFLMKERPSRDDRRGGRDDRRGGRDDRRDDRRGGRDDRRGGRDDRGDRGGYSVSEGKKLYRLAVGKRQNVQPGAIMGALANEGGMRGSDIGRISIRFDHTLVELPADLSGSDMNMLGDIRIKGEALDVRPDSGPPQGRPGSHTPRGGRDDDRGGRGGRGGFRADDRGGRGGRGGYGGGRDDDRRGGRGGFRDDDRGGRGGRGGYGGGRDDDRGGREGRGGYGGGRDDRGGRGGFRSRSHR